MIEEIEIDYKMVMDRVTIICGETGTGKTTVITDILYQLHNHVEQILVISPTDPQNHSYDCGLVPKPFIHYKITPELLTNIYERQQALAAVYTKANKAEVLAALYRRVPGREMFDRAIDGARKALERNLVGITDSGTINAMRAKFEDFNDMIRKHAIAKNKSYLMRGDLSEAEKISLTYLMFNPRMVIIFDDCTDLINKFKNHEVMQKIFYQGRHVFITALFACHTDKALSPELKKNAFSFIFTAQSSARSYFERGSNDFSKDQKRYALAAVASTFTQLAPHQKLIRMREGERLYRYTAARHDGFRFGSPHIWDYGEKIKTADGSVSQTNKFIHEFL